VRYAHARTIQVAPRFGEIRFQTLSLRVNPGSPNAPTHKQADRASVIDIRYPPRFQASSETTYVTLRSESWQRSLY